jgi:hypothetical protein
VHDNPWAAYCEALKVHGVICPYKSLEDQVCKPH